MRTRPIIIAAALIAAALALPGAPAVASAELPPPGLSAGCEGTAAEPAPLVVALHGYRSSPRLMLAESGLADAADAAGAVVVAPQAPGSPARWSTPGGLRPGGGTVATVATALRRAAERACVDLQRITVVGYSNGALMATWLACEWGDRVAAVVLVSGASLGPACAPAVTTAASALLVHGIDDDVVPIAGGPVLGGRLEAAPWSGAEARWPGAQVLLVEGAKHRWPSPEVAGVDIAQLAVRLAG